MSHLLTVQLSPELAWRNWPVFCALGSHTIGTYPQPNVPFPMFLLFLLVSRREFPFKISILTDLKNTFWWLKNNF